jgi:hypothetical protein
MTFGMQGATGFEVLQFSYKVHAKVQCDLAIDTQHAMRLWWSELKTEQQQHMYGHNHHQHQQQGAILDKSNGQKVPGASSEVGALEERWNQHHRR